MRPATGLLIVALIALPACAAVRDRDDGRDAVALAKALAGRAPGEARRCVSASQVGAAMIVGRTLLYRDGRTLWRNDVSDCPALAADPIMIVDVFGDRLCENDTFQTVARGGTAIPGPFCRFGKFTPYRAPR